MWRAIVGCAGLLCGVLLTVVLKDGILVQPAPTMRGYDIMHAIFMARVLSIDEEQGTMLVQPLIDNNLIAQAKPLPERLRYDTKTTWYRREVSGEGGVATRFVQTELGKRPVIEKGNLLRMRIDEDALVGILGIYTSILYQKSDAVDYGKFVQRFTRTITILAVDAKTRSVLASAHLDTGPYTNLRFTVPVSTNIFEQEAIIDNGVVVGFKPPRIVGFDSLRTGMPALVTLSSDSSGRLSALAMIVNGIFDRE